MKKKVGFYGGSFDPIHNGHLHIALQALEHYELDEIIFCPAGHSPFKEKQAHHTSGLHRLAMVKEAIEGIKSFSALDLEIKRPGPSYTVDTLEKLRELRPADSFFLIVADDQLERFSKWKEYQKIALLAPLKVGARLYRSYEELMKVSSFPVKEKDCFFGPLLEISSTVIRERIKKGLYIKHLSPSKVVDYIESHRLYLND